MNSLKVKFAIIMMLVGILSACGSQPTQAPASQPTGASAPATETPTAVPTDAVPSQPTTSGAQASTVSFANDILPLLQSRCVSCHGGQRTEEGLNLNTYDGIMAGSKNGIVITAGDANNSMLADLVSSQKMPKRGPKLTPSQVQTIVDWINQGALNN